MKRAAWMTSFCLVGGLELGVWLLGSVRNSRKRWARWWQQYACCHKASVPPDKERPHMSWAAELMPFTELRVLLMATWRWTWWDLPGEDSEGLGASSRLLGTDRTYSLVARGEAAWCHGRKPSSKMRLKSKSLFRYLTCCVTLAKLNSTSQFSHLYYRGVISTCRVVIKKNTNANL